MSRSDSKIDLDKYKPSLEDARRIADEEAAQERLRKALDNPALDAAIAEVGKEPARTSNPSPWSKDGDAAVDQQALPSAAAPVPPVTTRIKRGRGHLRGWSPTHKALAAIALAFLPAMVVFILFVKPQQPASSPVPSAAAASVAPTAPTAPPPPSEPRASAGSPEPSATASGAEPSASATASAAAPMPNGTARKPKPRSAVDDPYDAAPPAAAKTAEPQPSAAPPPPKTASPAPGPIPMFEREP